MDDCAGLQNIGGGIMDRIDWMRGFRWGKIRLDYSFNKFVDILRETYTDFFEDIDVGLLPEEIKRYRYLEPSEPVGSDSARSTIEEIRERGIETIAVYVPYHLSRRWGIYMFWEKLNGLAYYISKHLLGLPFNEAFISCERAIIEHECFHFQTEYSATIMETITAKPLYLPYFQSSRPYDMDEEAIANAWMLSSKSENITKIKYAMREICNVSPPGYRDYHKYILRGNVDYVSVKKFWAQRFLGSSSLILLPVRVEMPSAYSMTPIYFISIERRPEIHDAIHFITNNLRLEDLVKRLKKVLPDKIEYASATGIKLKTGEFIHTHYHPREGGAKLVKIINEVADKLGIDRKWLKEAILRGK